MYKKSKRQVFQPILSHLSHIFQMMISFTSAILLVFLPGVSTNDALGPAIMDLAFRLDAHVTHRLPNHNSAFSPLGISGLLSLFVPGSEGETQTEVINVLQLRDIEMDLYGKMYDSLRQDNEDVTVLEIANRIYSRFGLKLSGDYVREIFKNFGAEISELDFSGDPFGSQKSINWWFSNTTRGSVDKLLESPLPADTFIFIANAVYFKAFWKTPFDIKDTKIGKFYTSENDGINMMMMKISNIMLKVATDQDNKLTIVALPYSDARTSMLIVLPDVGNSLNDVMASINSSYLMQQLERQMQFKVTLTLPRFQLQVNYEMSDILKSMGLERLFEPSDAELKPMFGSHGYYAQKIVHSVSIDVMENGTEASGTSFATIGLSKTPTLEINVNRPFTFLIYDEPTECVLFMGRFVTPPSGDGERLLANADGDRDSTSGADKKQSNMVLVILISGCLCLTFNSFGKQIGEK